MAKGINLALASAGLLATALALPASAQSTYPARVVRVIDGDTLELDVAIWPGLTSRTKVRLVGVNAPEMSGAPCEAKAAAAAREFVQKWAERRSLTLTLAGTDKYGRTLGRVHAGAVDLSTELLAAGHARPYVGEKRKPWC